ncbi:MAG: Uma2 family endonuclease [Pseudomonadota bacterium]
MNIHTEPSADGIVRVTTDDGIPLPRHRFSVDDCFRMVETGVLASDYRFELLDGEIVPMSPKGAAHLIVQVALQNAWGRRRPDEVLIATEPTVRVGSDAFVEPDLFIWPARKSIADVALSDAVLIVEIAATSLTIDLGRKAQIYAAAGVPEYWVIDADRLEVHIHREPTGDRFASLITVAASETLTPSTVPALAVSLAELELPSADEKE